MAIETIQIKRGLEANLPRLAEGELALTTDSDKIFVGTANGNIQVLNPNVINQIGSLPSLQTTHKDTLVNAINDNASSLSSLTTQVTTNTSSLADMAYDVKNPPAPLVGAKGDGVTDDSGAIQGLINRIQSTYDTSNPNNNIGYKILFPAGKYLIKSSIAFKAPISFEGIGGIGSTYIVGDGSLTSDMFVCQDTTSSIRFTFKNLRFTGIPAGYAAIRGTNYSVDCEVRSCWFDNYGTNNSYGIRGQFGDISIEGNIFEHLTAGIYGETHANTIRISNNEFFYMQGPSIHMEGLASPNQWQTKEFTIIGNTFDFNTGTGTSAIYLNNYHLGVIVGNTVNNGDGQSTQYFLDRFVYLNNCYDIAIVGNVVQGVNLHGIYLVGCTYCRVNNNILRTHLDNTNSVNGVELSNSNNNDISHNTLYDFGKMATSQGVLLGSSNNNIVMGNVINDVNWGVRETGTSTGNIVKNNKLLSNISANYALLTADNDDRLGQIAVRDSTVDYGLNLNDVEIQTYTANLTAFHTISLPSGTPKGYKFSVVRKDTGTSTLQIYDNMGSVSLVTINNKTGVDLTCDGTKWNIVRQYTVQ